jgi:uncharacterized membrane protein
MSTVLLIAGLVIIAVGLLLVVFAPKPKKVERPPSREGVDVDIGKILEEINKLLAQLDARFRIGVVVMFVGLTLVGVGAWLEAKDAKDEAKEAKQATALIKQDAPGSRSLQPTRF